MNRRVYKNTFILASLRILNPLLSMALVAFISRAKGPEFLGAYAVIITLSGVFAAVGEMGLQVLITREVAGARERASLYLPSALFIGIVAAGMIAGGINASAGLWGYSPEVTMCLRVMTLYIMLSIIVGFFEAFFIAFERIGLMFFEQIFSNMIKLVGSLIVILMGYDLFEFVLIITLSGVAAVAACFYMFARHIGKVTMRIDWKTTRFLITNSPAFFVTTLFGVVLSMRMDIIILSKMSDLVQVALYAAAFKLFETALILPQSFMTSFFPQLSRLYIADGTGFKHMIRSIFRNTFFYVIAITVVMYGVAGLAIYIVYGGKFDGAVTPFKVLLLGLLPWAAAKVSGQVLIASGRQRLDMISTMAATVSNLLLNFILIPRYGAPGAALANTVSLIVFCVPQLWFARATLQRPVFALQVKQVSK